MISIYIVSLEATSMLSLLLQHILSLRNETGLSLQKWSVFIFTNTRLT